MVGIEPWVYVSTMSTGHRSGLSKERPNLSLTKSGRDQRINRISSREEGRNEVGHANRSPAQSASSNITHSTQQILLLLTYCAWIILYFLVGVTVTE